MSLDDRILFLQRAIDRLVRRLRRGGAAQPTRRRFVIVQIDGLSRDVLDQGLRSGHMPFLKRSLRRHGYRLEPNVSFTPDQKWIVFRSNMFGPTYAFAVEVAKAN